jgi:hypothetical protein
MTQLAKIIFALSFFATTFSFGQEFCGHIKYSHRYFLTKNNKEVTSKVKDVKTEDFYVCGNNIKIYFDGHLSEIYIGDSVVYFQIMPDSIIAYFKADSAYGEPSPRYVNPQFSVIYNDKIYMSLDENSDNEKMSYYFNDKIKIDPLSFEKNRAISLE